jgi:hypothetical protein
MRPTRIPAVILDAMAGIASGPVSGLGSIRGSISDAVQSESIDGL